MTHEEARQLEDEFKILLPARYRNAARFDPHCGPMEEFATSAEDLRISNLGCRERNPWGFQWEDRFWWIGGDGSGGLYFIDTSDADVIVYYLDHEMPARSIEDREELVPQPLYDFLNDTVGGEKAEAASDRIMQTRVAARKWWQFWIPREWPLKPKR